MKSLFFLFIIALLPYSLFAQVITGKIIDNNTGKPVEYVSIGVLNTPLGAISNEDGFFKIEVGAQSPKSEVRVSMIGYKGQSFSIESLLDKENIIKLVENPTPIAEVVIKQSGKERKVGTTSCSARALCGLATDQSKDPNGYEIGTILSLGPTAVKIKKFTVRIHKQPFDTVFLRLHFRTISNGLPYEDLLSKNIVLPLTKESGWQHFDLTQHNIILSGEVALSVEFVKFKGPHKDRFVRMGTIKEPRANVLFNAKRHKGCIFTKWGAQAKWNRYETESPTMFVTVI